MVAICINQRACKPQRDAVNTLPLWHCWCNALDRWQLNELTALKQLETIFKTVIMLNQLQNHNKLRAWLKRFGFFGFMFFFIKGLGWIAVVYFGIKLF